MLRSGKKGDNFSQVDKQLETGEYFLLEKKRLDEKKKDKKEKQVENTEKRWAIFDSPSFSFTFLLISPIQDGEQ